MPPRSVRPSVFRWSCSFERRHRVPVVRAQEPAKTVADGVYTDAQAVRGAAAYDTACAHAIVPT